MVPVFPNDQQENKHPSIHEGSEARQVSGSEDTSQQVFSPRRENDVATNDGSVVETLDTAFHNKPGWSEGENLSGSDRADYYEARSDGKSDAEEELDVIRKRNAPEE